MGCSFRPDWVAGFLRIRWQLCTGLGGRNHRNTQSMRWRSLDAPACASLTSPAPGSTTATTSSSIPCTWCTSRDRRVATSSTCDQRVGHGRLPHADDIFCTPQQPTLVNSAAFIVLPTLSLDTDKNRCENRRTEAYDKSDYRTLNQGQIWRQKRGQIRPHKHSYRQGRQASSR